ncbi:MAG TPA: hypothetical protein VKB48_00515 [Candidatus Acidoferrum sp.]|nr:hypothetical protein [Candidatus Acidoferrum sp.]
MKPKDSANVNVTLGRPGPPAEKLLGKCFPCPVCTSPMPIRLTRKQKPYCHCLSCMLQIFFRGKVAIDRLGELLDSGILASGSDSPADMAITLYNRIQMLSLQIDQLKAKRSLLFSNQDLENVISVFENEIAELQYNLEQIVHVGSREK